MHERPTLDQLIPTESSYAEKRVENATSDLRRAARDSVIVYAKVSGSAAPEAADVELRRAALRYAAAKIAETGEHGTKDALTLLSQIAEDVR